MAFVPAIETVAQGLLWSLGVAGVVATATLQGQEPPDKFIDSLGQRLRPTTTDTLEGELRGVIKETIGSSHGHGVERPTTPVHKRRKKGEHFFDSATGPVLVSASSARVASMARRSKSGGKKTSRRRTGRRVTRRGRLYTGQRLKEIKTVQQQTGPTTCATTGSLFTCNILAQGTGANQRIGRNVNFRKMDYVLSLDRPDNTAYTPGTTPAMVRFRIMFVFDREPIGAAPAINSILRNAAYDETYNTDNVLTPGCRFSILSDKIYNMPLNISMLGNSTGGYAGGHLTIHETLWLKKSTHYANASANTIADILKGALYFVCIADTGTDQTSKLTFTLFFTDEK